MTWLTAMEYLCHNDHRYVPLIESTSPAFPHSRLSIGFVTRLTRRVTLVDQDLQTILEHLRSPRSVVGLVLIDLYLYIYVCRSLFFLLHMSTIFAVFVYT